MTEAEAAIAAAAATPIEKQIATVRRELAMRRGVYTRRVAAGAMSEEQAAAETRAMLAVLGTLLQLAPAPAPAVASAQTRLFDREA